MYLIVGVDPGTTTGIAALTLEGKVFNICSSRNMGVDRAVKHITTLGRPSLVASDVNPVPESVLKIASSLGCRLFTPYESLSVAVKNTLTSGYEVEDLHARDALAAALNTFNKYRNKLEKISSLGYGDEVKHKVLQGTSLERVLQEKARNLPQLGKKKTIAGREKPAKTVPARLKFLENQNKLLLEQISQKDLELIRLKKELSSAKTSFRESLFRKPEFKQQEKVIESLEYQIKVLQEKLEKTDEIRELWCKLAQGEIAPVGIHHEVLAGLTYIKYRLTPEEAGEIKNVTLAFTEDSKNREMLLKQGVNVADAKKIHESQGVAYISKEDLNQLMHSNLKSLESIIGEYRLERSRKR
ncbi:MAG: DUF460 domain-containing protein [Candidatus Altiarchaeales archaeon]|nr:DUF460 domain-containing protein [Candidatus Altiarchaeales archaeon]